MNALFVTLDEYERFGAASTLNRLGYRCALYRNGWIEVSRGGAPLFIAPDEPALRRWLQGRGELESPVRVA